MIAINYAQTILADFNRTWAEQHSLKKLPARLQICAWFNLNLSSQWFIVPSIILSGFATPIANMPEVMQTFTLVNPLRYFLVIVRGVMLEGIPLRLLSDQY